MSGCQRMNKKCLLDWKSCLPIVSQFSSCEEGVARCTIWSVIKIQLVVSKLLHKQIMQHHPPPLIPPPANHCFITFQLAVSQIVKNQTRPEANVLKGIDSLLHSEIKQEFTTKLPSLPLLTLKHLPLPPSLPTLSSSSSSSSQPSCSRHPGSAAVTRRRN